MNGSSAPSAFISYSHDSEVHKEWVLKFAKQLRDNGVRVSIDQWDLRPGVDLGVFMEKSLKSVDWVLLIVTDEYIRKADAGVGGVGYEKMIVTAELVESIDTNKFIPIIRNVVGRKKLPAFMGSRRFVDLSDEQDQESQLQSLLRCLHGMPAEDLPPLGDSPFSFRVSVQKNEAKGVLSGFDGLDVSKPEEVYDLGFELARNKDQLGWRKLSKAVNTPLVPFQEWRKRHEVTHPTGTDELCKALDEAVSIVASRIVLALVGVESGLPSLRDQRYVFEEIYRIPDWNPSGTTWIVELPSALGFVFHFLHGSVCLATGQHEVATDLADMKVHFPFERESQTLTSRNDLMGWVPTLGENCTTSWRYLSTAYERWPWLRRIFKDDAEFRASLVAYSLTLSVDEFARSLRSEESLSWLRKATEARLDIPLTFVSERLAVNQAVSVVRRNLPDLLQRWESWGVREELARENWQHWVRVCNAWVAGVYRFSASGVPFQDLF